MRENRPTYQEFFSSSQDHLEKAMTDQSSPTRQNRTRSKPAGMVGGIEVLDQNICLIPVDSDNGRDLIQVNLYEEIDETDVHYPVEESSKACSRLASLTVNNEILQSDLDHCYIATLFRLARIIDDLDSHTAWHSAHTMTWTHKLAMRMHLDHDMIRDLMRASRLHDVGKVIVPKLILTKPMRLEEHEWRFIRRHPSVGASLIARSERLKMISTLVMHHHEHYDGSGYPSNLEGEQIPLGARILAVADAYSTMTDGRIYKPPLVVSEALAELRRCRGSQFDPYITDTMIRIVKDTI